MKKRISEVIVLTLCALLLSIAESSAQDVKVDLYEAPKPLKRRAPEYPETQLMRRVEGSVEFNMMIDETGKPFEITMSNSTGDKEFVDEALRVVKWWSFEPAKSGGKPIVGSTRTLLVFELDDSAGANKGFVRAYKAFYEAVKSQPQEESQALLTQLEELTRNRYEVAFFNLARFLYADKYGNSLEQMRFLSAALSFARDKKDKVYLPKKDAQFARRTLMNLQTTNRYYREALFTYRYFEFVGDTEALGMFKRVADQIEELDKNDTTYDVPVELDKGGSFNIGLLKHKVYITTVEGKIAEFKVRCEKKYVGFPVEADVVYDIPKQWGVCNLEIVGDAGAKLKLMQQ